MELNREKTIEALECLQDEDSIFCNPKCYYYDYLCKTYHCERAVGRDALALINSQEQRIKELAEENKRLKSEVYVKRKLLDKANVRMKCLEEVNKVLQADICNATMNLEHITKENEMLKADTVREMQERLCEGRVSNDPVVIATNVITKEMLEDA